MSLTRLAPPSTSNLSRFRSYPSSRSNGSLPARRDCRNVGQSAFPAMQSSLMLEPRICDNGIAFAPIKASRGAGFSDPVQVMAVSRALRSVTLVATQPRILTRSGGGSSLPPSACTSTIIPVATIIDDVVCRTRKCLFLGSMSGMYAALRRSSPAPPNPLMLPRYGHCL